MYIEYIEKMMFNRGLRKNVIKNKVAQLYKQIEWKLIEIFLTFKFKELNFNLKQIKNVLLYIGFTILSEFKLEKYHIESYLNNIAQPFNQQNLTMS